MFCNQVLYISVMIALHLRLHCSEQNSALFH